VVDAVEKKVPGQGYGYHNWTPRETHACFMPLDADAETNKGRPGHAAREETGMVGCLGAGTGLYELPARATSEVRNEDFLAKAKWRRRIRQPFLFDIQLGYVRGTDDFPLGAEDDDQPIESPPAVLMGFAGSGPVFGFREAVADSLDLVTEDGGALRGAATTRGREPGKRRFLLLLAGSLCWAGTGRKLGPATPAAIKVDEASREKRAAERRLRETTRGQDQEMAETWRTVCQEFEEAMKAAGYHNPQRRGWRKRRSAKAKPTERNP
jgi:hypothetical protein